jgi:hypothetical protein
MTAFIAFTNGALGRWLRVALGIALIVCGLAVLGGTAGLLIAALGLVPVALGAWGRCLPEFCLPRGSTVS